MYLLLWHVTSHLSLPKVIWESMKTGNPLEGRSVSVFSSSESVAAPASRLTIVLCTGCLYK